MSADELGRVQSGAVDEATLRRLAAALDLGADALVASANKTWFPQPVALDGFAQFNTTFEDMTVNAYLVWDPQTKAAAAFDTGATAGPMLEFAQEHQLAIKLILLTHTHADHIADLARLKEATGAPAFVGQLEPTEGAETFAAGRVFTVGRLKIETRLTTGHSPGAITYVVHGLKRPVAVVGDAVFAGSMGGGKVSFADALATNRRHIFSLPDETILGPGHGPLTTLAEQKAHNPFYPEFQNSNSQTKERKTMAEKIGFVGVGRMGANMARRLKDSGYAVTAVYDVRPGAALALAREVGAEACTSLARVTALSDVVITVVTDDKAMLQIFGGKGDNLLVGAKGRVFINCATISPKSTSPSSSLRARRRPNRSKPAWPPASRRRVKARFT